MTGPEKKKHRISKECVRERIYVFFMFLFSSSEGMFSD